MAIVMRVNTKTTNSMDKAHISGLMVTAIKANTRTTYAKAKALFIGLMAIAMKANGRTTNTMDKARCFIRMARRNPAVGIWVNLWNNEIHSLIEGASDYCAQIGRAHV